MFDVPRRVTDVVGVLPGCGTTAGIFKDKTADDKYFFDNYRPFHYGDIRGALSFSKTWECRIDNTDNEAGGDVKELYYSKHQFDNF